MSDEDQRFQVACPHPSCEGTIPVRAELPAGDYWCRCKAARLSLSWTPCTDGTREPTLTLRKGQLHHG